MPADANWPIIKQAIDAIHSKIGSPLGYGELLQIAHNMIKAKNEEKFYTESKKVTNDHMRPIATKLCQQQQAEELLAQICNDWDFCKEAFIKIKDFFIPLRKYITKMKYKSIYDQQVQCFREDIFLHPTLNRKLFNTMLDQVRKERNGDNMDRIAMQRIIVMIDEIDEPSNKQLYETQFETQFLADTKEFYNKESLQLLTQNSTPDYIKKIHQRYSEEQDRADSYLKPSTKEKLMQTFLDEVITKHALTIMEKNSGLDDMLENERYLELRMMFDLFKHRDASMKCLQTKVIQYIVNTGSKIVDKSQKEDERLPNLIKFREKMFNFHQESFNKDFHMEGTLTKGFDEFICNSENTTKDLNRYFDKLFKDDFCKNSQIEIEKKIQEAIFIFSHILDKDFFENMYRTSLAKRLMSTESRGASILQDAEKEVIKLLKKDIGASYTQRLEVMLADVESSIGQMNEFKKTNTFKQIKIEFQAKVLTGGSWPRLNTEKNKVVQAIPQEISQCMDSFAQYYMSTYQQNRKIEWSLDNGSSEVHFTPKDNKKYRVTMSTRQTCIVYMFNYITAISCQQMMDSMGVGKNVLEPQLISLCKSKILIKDKGPFSENSNFKYNQSFTYNKTAFTLNPSQKKEEDPEDIQKRDLELKKERKIRIDASIVRIMKGRKKCNFNTLITDCTKQVITQFKPEPRMIRQQIEDLIERDYIKRDEKDKTVFHYVA